MRSNPRARWLGFAATVAAVGAVSMLLLRPPVAEACGIFPRSIDLRPTLSREKVVIIHDAEKGVEHFIREVVFNRATDPLGFVVPTPTRPSVHPMKPPPFGALRERFPFLPRPRGVIGANGGGKGNGGPGVEVLETKRVGSFTAFVLAANDETALAGWLEENQLRMPAEAQPWLKRYVDLRFYYVALRFDPPARKRAPRPGDPPPTLDAETLRISFEAPLPYYPYLEPTDPARSKASTRLLEVWYVGTEPMVPVALLDEGGTKTWTRPLRAGERYADARAPLETAARPQLEQLLPSGPLQLQTFQDQKRSRDGFGDIVFVPETRRALDPQRRAELAKFASLLDPTLTPPASEAAR